jgi:mannose-6-phosphate isomerase-like protein (cupin superfamily)
MKIARAKDAEIFTIPEISFKAREYGLGDRDLDCCLAEVRGEYPGKDRYALNAECKEVLFCAKGSGVVEMKSGEAKKFEKNDVVLIEKNTGYRFKGNFDAVIVCSPPWSPTQHKQIY